MDKLPQLAPKPLAESHHRQAAQALVTLYHDAHDGIRRVVALGLFCLEVKTRLPHGQFRDWLQQWVSPIDSRIKLASLDAYMGITKNVLTECGFQISSALEICDSPSSILMLPEDKTPIEAKPMRAKILDIIEGKTARQLIFEFRSSKSCTVGGDHAWQKWCARFHPELLKDGKAPLIGHTPKAVRREFEQYLTAQAAASIGKRAEVETKEAKDHVRRLVRDLGGKLLRNDILLCGADLLEQLEDARVELGHIIKDAKRTAK